MPVHSNPNVHDVIFNKFGRNKNVRLVSPLDYIKMIHAMKKSAFIITDSGGIQEEAISLNKPVLVAREITERPEGIKIGAAKLVGSNSAIITEEAVKLVIDQDVYKSMINKKNPYGDGHASQKIVDYLLKI